MQQIKEDTIMPQKTVVQKTFTRVIYVITPHKEPASAA